MKTTDLLKSLRVVLPSYKSPELALLRQILYSLWKLALCHSSNDVLDKRYMALNLM